MIQSSWKKAGVELRLKTEDVSLFSVRTGANKHDAAAWRGEGGLGHGVIVYPRWYIPFGSGSYFAVPWAEWHTSGGASGEEPPEAVKEHLALYDQVRATGDLKEQVRLMRKVLRTSVEQFYAIGLALPTQTYGLVKNSLHNVTDPMLYGWYYPSPGPSNPQQWYFEET